MSNTKLKLESSDNDSEESNGYGESIRATYLLKKDAIWGYNNPPENWSFTSPIKTRHDDERIKSYGHHSEYLTWNNKHKQMTTKDEMRALMWLVDEFKELSRLGYFHYMRIFDHNDEVILEDKNSYFKDKDIDEYEKQVHDAPKQLYYDHSLQNQKKEINILFSKIKKMEKEINLLKQKPSYNITVPSHSLISSTQPNLLYKYNVSVPSQSTNEPLNFTRIVNPDGTTTYSYNISS